MKQLPSGFWVPGEIYGNSFFKGITKRGLPSYCEPEVKACLAFLDPSRRSFAIDGGAYVGTWSMHLIQHFKHVLAFEPIEQNVSCYKKNMEFIQRPKRHSWEIETTALSETSGTGVLLDIGKEYGHRFDTYGRHQVINTLPTLTRSLDSYGVQALDLLKLDVEGHECWVLQGASSTLLKFKPVVIIEEKLDPKKRATKLLLDLGMRNVWRSRKHDYLFAW